MEVNKEINPTVWRKVEKTNNPKLGEFIMKVDVERFGLDNFLQDIKFMKNVKVRKIHNNIRCNECFFLYTLSFLQLFH